MLDSQDTELLFTSLPHVAGAGRRFAVIALTALC